MLWMSLVPDDKIVITLPYHCRAILWSFVYFSLVYSDATHQHAFFYIHINVLLFFIFHCVLDLNRIWIYVYFRYMCFAHPSRILLVFTYFLCAVYTHYWNVIREKKMGEKTNVNCKILCCYVLFKLIAWFTP